MRKVFVSVALALLFCVVGVRVSLAQTSTPTPTVTPDASYWETDNSAAPPGDWETDPLTPAPTPEYGATVVPDGGAYKIADVWAADGWDRGGLQHRLVFTPTQGVIAGEILVNNYNDYLPNQSLTGFAVVKAEGIRFYSGSYSSRRLWSIYLSQDGANAGVWFNPESASGWTEFPATGVLIGSDAGVGAWHSFQVIWDYAGVPGGTSYITVTWDSQVTVFSAMIAGWGGAERVTGLTSLYVGVYDSYLYGSNPSMTFDNFRIIEMATTLPVAAPIIPEVYSVVATAQYTTTASLVVCTEFPCWLSDWTGDFTESEPAYYRFSVVPADEAITQTLAVAEFYGCALGTGRPVAAVVGLGSSWFGTASSPFAASEEYTGTYRLSSRGYAGVLSSWTAGYPYLENPDLGTFGVGSVEIDPSLWDWYKVRLWLYAANGVGVTGTPPDDGWYDQTSLDLSCGVGGMDGLVNVPFTNTVITTSPMTSTVSPVTLGLVAPGYIPCYEVIPYFSYSGTLLSYAVAFEIPSFNVCTWPYTFSLVVFGFDFGSLLPVVLGVFVLGFFVRVILS